jgi:hypothetical protein
LYGGAAAAVATAEDDDARRRGMLDRTDVVEVGVLKWSVGETKLSDGECTGGGVGTEMPTVDICCLPAGF